MDKPTYFINGIGKGEILNRIMEKIVLNELFIKDGCNRQKLTIYEDQVLQYFS